MEGYPRKSSERETAPPDTEWLLEPDSVIGPSQNTDTITGFSCTKLSRFCKITHRWFNLWPVLLFTFVRITQTACIHNFNSELMVFTRKTTARISAGRMHYKEWQLQYLQPLCKSSVANVFLKWPSSLNSCTSRSPSPNNYSFKSLLAFRFISLTALNG